MASSQLSFTQALEYLNEIQKHINEVRLLNESTCRDITQLLYKPWPGKTSPASSSLTGTQEGSRGPASAHGQADNDDVFSIEEQSMLAEVDSVLAQAQKLRQFQNKVKIKHSSNSIQDENSLKSESYKPTEVAEPSVASNQQHDRNSQDEPTNHNTNNSGGNASDVAVISARDLDRLLKKAPPLKKEQTSKTSRPTSGTVKTSHQPKSKRTVAGPAGLGRPALRKDTQPKTSSAEIGRHVSKPASRFGDTQSRYMQTAKTKALTKEKLKKATTQLSGNQTSLRQISSQSQSKRPLSAKGVSNEVPRVQSGKSNVENEQNHSRTQRSTDSFDMDQVTQSIAQLEVSKPHEARSGSTHQETKSCSSTQADTTPRIEKIPFVLRTEGSSLTIPTKLKKQYQNNAKLRDKVTSLLRGDVCHHSDHFLDLFGDNPSSSLPLDAELQRLIAEYKHLIQLTRDVRKQLQAIHGKTHWEDVYYLQTMSKVIRQRQEEIRRQFNELKDSLSDRSDVTVSRTTPKATNSSPFLWHQVDKFKDEWLSLPDGNILQYSSRAHLLKWNELVYQIQLIQQEKIIQEVAGGAILDLLSGIDSGDASYPALYRIAHGLILNCGSVYPSMISDEERSITPAPGY